MIPCSVGSYEFITVHGDDDDDDVDDDGGGDARAEQ